MPPQSMSEAIKDFEKKFKDKTANNWVLRGGQGQGGQGTGGV